MNMLMWTSEVFLRFHKIGYAISVLHSWISHHIRTIRIFIEHLRGVIISAKYLSIEGAIICYLPLSLSLSVRVSSAIMLEGKERFE